jgi:quinoprotein glucose dehydrogenase
MALRTKAFVRMAAAAAVLLLGLLTVAPPFTGPAPRARAEGPDGARKPEDPAAYRAFARRHAGDAASGAKLFLGDRLGCVSCHGKPGDGGDIGPDLAGVGLRHDRDGLITEVLEPSKKVVPGYGAVTLELKQSGKTLTGKFLGETCEAIKLKDSTGVRDVAKADVETWDVRSPMPGGLYREMTLQEFADLIAFLEARGEE